METLRAVVLRLTAIAKGKMKKTTTEEFIEKAKAVHGDKYHYSKVAYEHSKKPVIILQIIRHSQNGL